MKYLDLTLPTPAENLALDEALLNQAEQGDCPEVLRFWSPAEYFVVLGYANRAAREVQLEACQAAGVPVLRRCSGGGTVLQGPGCLNYTLVLRIREDGPLAAITSANRWILEHHQHALSALLGQPVAIQGQTDLTLGEVKFSGNAQRRLRHHLLFHGTFLVGMNLARVEQFLPLPSRAPAYRAGRGHREFLTNLAVREADMKTTLRAVWKADEVFTDPPVTKARQLALEKYATAEWTFRF